MRNDWIFDAVQAEVVYRTEELYKAGQGTRPLRRRRWRLGRKHAEIKIPEQRRPSRDESPSRVSAQ
ncbi:hypothetical protein HFP15_09230 [Amycolatopsis sp. K13G38]|uniref:Uncharacterized protein n=1 Tax=Amycolatopsis acididurans TaxID=2724524 RepID=A0ABX1IZX2_9PSEU|nr:hypothetical protein [Amycolatopsis acididurans]NKQ53063.1 hypothetical protein [Amycolatopsis acididurans]